VSHIGGATCHIDLAYLDEGLGGNQVPRVEGYECHVMPGGMTR
jgi:hypothetical protein